MLENNNETYETITDYNENVSTEKTNVYSIIEHLLKDEKITVKEAMVLMEAIIRKNDEPNFSINKKGYPINVKITNTEEPNKLELNWTGTWKTTCTC